MPTLKEISVNCTTGETLEILHEISQEVWDAQQAELLAIETAKEEALATTEALKQSAKAKLIAGQPLTEEEAAVLVI
jgi:hypothetical protein